jgi:hypothetical protein
MGKIDKPQYAIDHSIPYRYKSILPAYGNPGQNIRQYNLKKVHRILLSSKDKHKGISYQPSAVSRCL